MAKQEQPTKAETMQAIGLIAARFSLLELTVSALIWTLIGTHQRIGRLVTGRLSFSQLLTLLQLLNNETVEDEDHQRRIKEAISRARKANDRRNEIVHSVWAFAEDPSAITRMKLAVTETKFDFQAEGLTVKQLRAFATRIQKLSDDFIQLLTDA